MAERTGLEPATPCVTGRYSNRLNYRSTEFFYNHRFYDRLTAKFDAWQFPTLAWGDPTLPSALRRFTSEFGMGSGGTTALRPPGKFCLSTRPVLTCRFNLYQAYLSMSLPPKHLRRCKVKPHGSLVPVSSTHRLSLIHISEPTRQPSSSRMPSSA